MTMRDLFDIFPDLPRGRRQPVGDRIAEIRRRADAMREKMRINARDKKAAAARNKAAWERRLKNPRGPR
jgi:hypothetical protein